MWRVRDIGAVLLGALFLVASLSPSWAESKAVAFPSLEGGEFSPRVLYVENERFPRITVAELKIILQTAASLVSEHFGIAMNVPMLVQKADIDTVFTDLVAKTPDGFKGLMGDFRNDAVDWPSVKELIGEQVKSYKGALSDQIEFAKPYLMTAPVSNSVGDFTDAVVDTFQARLSYWTQATLADGAPIIGKVSGREDLPLNEYGYWTLMAKLGVEAELVLTNQLIASVEYIPTPVHTAIRGGITGGSTEYNPVSEVGASVWMSVAPFLMEDKQIDFLRQNRRYSREEALRYAGILLAHEIGHLVLHLGHPWANTSCLMRPAEVLDFATWSKNLDAAKCPLRSEEEMRPGVLQIPIW